MAFGSPLFNPVDSTVNVPLLEEHPAAVLSALSIATVPVV